MGEGFGLRLVGGGERFFWGGFAGVSPLGGGIEMFGFYGGRMGSRLRRCARGSLCFLQIVGRNA